MAWSFNAPPGWPQPPSNWVPPKEWKPDPSWPAAPSGWEFWRPTNGATPDADAEIRDAVSTHYRPSAYANDLKWALAGLRRSGWGFLVGLSTWGPGLILPYLFFPMVVIATIIGFGDGGVLGA